MEPEDELIQNEAERIKLVEQIIFDRRRSAVRPARKKRKARHFWIGLIAIDRKSVV